MKEDVAKLLIKEIDKRIENYFSDTNIICRQSARVVRVNPIESRATVILAGDLDKIEMTFPYRGNMLSLEAGDGVFIEYKLNNLMSGIICDKTFIREE